MNLAICDPGCMTCSSNNPSSCLMCLPGFYFALSNMMIGSCMPCTPSSNCYSCSSANNSQCLSCYTNMILMNGMCMACSSSCATCSSTNAKVCTSCPVGCVLSQGSCIAISLVASNSSACSFGCQSCNSNVCLLCYSGYSLNTNGYCTPCLPGCDTCSNSNYAICILCGAGTYPVGNSCVSCSANCLFCNTLGTCSQCLEGYVLSSQSTCIQSCQFPCATCVINEPSNCLSCLYGFTLNTGSLQNCQNNNTLCNANFNCSYCGLGYILITNNTATSINQTCKSCGQTCARCNPINVNNCTGCYIGFYLTTSSTCNACSTGCAAC